MHYMNKAMIPEGLRYFADPADRRTPYTGKGKKRKKYAAMRDARLLGSQRNYGTQYRGAV
jgi:hypothetical protein